jgi:catechol 2,3-dioxygenase
MVMNTQPVSPIFKEAKHRIAAATGVGPVHIGVSDAEVALAFYRDVIGLTALPSPEGEMRLGAGSLELVVLHPGASGRVPKHTSGLYHLAILVPSRRELARVIGRLMVRRQPNSPTDHVMTKADYLSDPDGNGIEIYTETPEDGTVTYFEDEIQVIDRNGIAQSPTGPIDLETLFAELQPEDDLEAPMPPGTKMGHVHLHVSDLPQALAFYHELIGFDIIGHIPSWGAAFISAGGYHHHLGLNTWAGVGAPPAPPERSGLRHFTIEVPSRRDLEEVVDRLQRAGVEPLPLLGGALVKDPSQNQALLTVRPAQT